MTEGVVRSRQNFVISKNFVDSASDAEFGVKFTRENYWERYRSKRSSEIG